MKIAVSACLIGISCRYDGKNNTLPELSELAKKHTLIPICPEQLGGLPTPREPSEITEKGVTTVLGEDVSEAFAKGAEQAIKIVGLTECEAALLKERSPSCGKGVVYDGTFSGKLVPGNGVFARKLLEMGVSVYGESEIKKLLDS